MAEQQVGIDAGLHAGVCVLRGGTADGLPVKPCRLQDEREVFPVPGRLGLHPAERLPDPLMAKPFPFFAEFTLGLVEGIDKDALWCPGIPVRAVAGTLSDERTEEGEGPFHVVIPGGH